MVDPAMMSPHYVKPGQRPEDDVRVIADALAVYLAWSLRNGVGRVKKTTISPVASPKAASGLASRAVGGDRAPISHQEPSSPLAPSRSIRSEADQRADIAAILGLMPYELL